MPQIRILPTYLTLFLITIIILGCNLQPSPPVRHPDVESNVEPVVETRKEPLTDTLSEHLPQVQVKAPGALVDFAGDEPADGFTSSGMNASDYFVEVSVNLSDAYSAAMTTTDSN